MFQQSIQLDCSPWSLRFKGISHSNKRELATKREDMCKPTLSRKIKGNPYCWFHMHKVRYPKFKNKK